MTESKYLKEVYRAYENGIPVVGPTYIGTMLGVNKTTAYQALQKLVKMDYGTYLKNKGFILGERGRDTAKRLIRHHRLLECLIVDSLGLSPKEACREADSMDIFMGEGISTALEKKYESRRLCPCGNEIPEVKP